MHLLALADLLTAILTGTLAVKCYAYAAHGEAVAFFEQLQAVPETEQKQGELRAKQSKRALWRWFLGLYLGMGIVLGVVAYLDGSIIFAVAMSPLQPSASGSGLLKALWLWYIMTTAALGPSLVPLPLLYVIVAAADAKWGPSKQPWLVLPPGIVLTRWARFNLFPLRLANGVVNLFRIGRTATLTFWLLVLLIGLGLAGYELYARLAAGDWPRPLDAKFGDHISTWLLALAVSYVLVSLVRLVRIMTT